MRTLKQLQEFIEDYGGEPDYEIKVRQFDGSIVSVDFFTFNSDTKEFKIHTTKKEG